MPEAGAATLSSLTPAVLPVLVDRLSDGGGRLVPLRTGHRRRGQRRTRAHADLQGASPRGAHVRRAEAARCHQEGLRHAAGAGADVSRAGGRLRHAVQDEQGGRAAEVDRVHAVPAAAEAAAGGGAGQPAQGGGGAADPQGQLRPSGEGAPGAARPAGRPGLGRGQVPGVSGGDRQPVPVVRGQRVDQQLRRALRLDDRLDGGGCEASGAARHLHPRAAADQAEPVAVAAAGPGPDCAFTARLVSMCLCSVWCRILSFGGMFISWLTHASG